MDGSVRRGRGEKVGNGVVKREIVRFLLSHEDGSGTESEIREHLYERYGVQDRATIRNQHLGYLRTRGLIDVAREPGKENVWSVVVDPSIAGYVFAEFAGDELAEVYRSPFFRDHVVRWFRARRRPVPRGAAESARLLFDRVTWEDAFLLEVYRLLEEEAVELSPSHYTGATIGTHEGNVAATLLLVSGRPVSRESGKEWPLSAMALGGLLADLLVDFERYGPLRRDIYAFMLRSELQELMASLFPPQAVMMVFQCLMALTINKPGFTREDCTLWIAREPMAIPPPPPGWRGSA